ncbi:MAG: GTP-binding protein [Candidatus Lokiarchaeota archaeon]|nr:GTP-binding protein [Candidatus Lokiarchaeota archaeon]
MIQNIFLIQGNDLQDVRALTILNYPHELVNKNSRLVKTIISDQDLEIKNTKSKNGSKNLKFHQIGKPLHFKVKDHAITTVLIDDGIIIGVMLEKDDNPHDYEDFFLEILHEIINENAFSFEDELERENLLITIFIDFRRYSQEVIKQIASAGLEKKSQIVKVFLFGLEEAGKTSLVRRIKTGEYEDNYFQPTRRFNIEHVHDDEIGVMAFWDMPGQLIFRKKWLAGAQDSNIIVYMIDVSDQIKFEESKTELHAIINRFELSNIPLLILGNKIDLVNQLSENGNGDNINEHLIRLKHEIFDILELEKINNRKIEFLFTSVKTNYNIEEFYELLIELL